MKVSVIIPTYNRADKLNNCLNSVFNQTYKNIEIIVCDDGSTDNTMEIVKKFSGVKYIFMENSGGPSKPRNIGIEYATGDVIAFLDSDDQWYPEKLTICTEAISSGFDFVHHNMNVYREGKLIKAGNIDKKTHTQKSILQYGNPFMTSSVMLKADIVKEVGLFNESLVNMEDYDYWIRSLSVTNKVETIRKSLGLYTFSKDSISRGAIKTRLQSLNTIYTTYSGLCNEEMPSWMNYEFAKCYAKMNENRKACKGFARSIINKYKVFKSLKNIFLLQVNRA